MKCPHCKSDRLRRSHRRPEDGAWRSIFYSAYRCRDCRQRFQQLNTSLVLGAGSVSLIALAFVGLAFVVLRYAPPEEALAQAGGAPVLAVARLDVSDLASTSPASAAVAAAADKGDANAQMQLGMAYMNGEGVARNPAVALGWMEKAADQGHADAQYVLGIIHQSGRGGLQSFPLALQWYERAARQNHAQAQYRLGLMYRAGQGVPVDRPKAYLWLNLAAAQGHERAGDARDELLSSLTREEVLAAQQASHEWRQAKSAQ